MWMHRKPVPPCPTRSIEIPMYLTVLFSFLAINDMSGLSSLESSFLTSSLLLPFSNNKCSQIKCTPPRRSPFDIAPIERRPIVIVMASPPAGMQKLLQVGTKIVAVGRNYAAHAKELGNAVPKEPVLFLKPTSSYLENGGTIEIPQPLESLHHEVELAVVVGRKARDVPESTAMDYVGGYALALDMTAREIQATAKAAGLPWTVAKGQDTFTPISSVLPKSNVPDPDNLELWLKVDGEIRQKGSTKDMIFKIPFLISHISTIMTLFEGDVILTGTPPGVGPVKIGQKITAGITDLIDVHFNVEKRKRPGSC